MNTSTTPALQTLRVTPVQRALALPEILSNIFAQRSKNSLTHFKTRSESSNLLKFALVNKTWYNEAIRELWGHPAHQLAPIMSTIPPHRRQYYADFIWWAHVQDYPYMDSFGPNGPFHGLKFPRLTQLSVCIYTKRLYVIPLAHPEEWVKEMYFKKRLPKDGIEEHHVDAILGVISNFIPPVDELWLRYEGPDSHLSGLVVAPKEGAALPGPNTHWFIDEAPVGSTVDLSYGYISVPRADNTDIWGSSNWADGYLDDFDPEAFNLADSNPNF